MSAQNRPKLNVADNRKRLIQLIHIGKNQLCLDDDTYRALLIGTVVKDSCADMTEAELDQVLAAMRQAGFKVSPSATKHLIVEPLNLAPGGPTAKQVYYIKGLWELASRAQSEESLRAILRRLTKVDDLRFVPRSKVNTVILALKDIARKAGYNPDRSPSRR